MISISFKNETDFTKKMRSLRIYFPQAYKELIFESRKRVSCGTPDGIYEKKLHASLAITDIHGDIKFIYSIQNGRMIAEDLEPQELLLEGHKRLLPTYKGIPYRNAQEKFKINLITMLKEREADENRV